LAGVAVVIGLVARGCTRIVSRGIIAVVVTGHGLSDMLSADRINDMRFPFFKNMGV
jgi:hypothetical protein